MRNISFDPIIAVAFWGGVLAAALCLVVVLEIAYLRWALLREKRQEQAFRSVWQSLLLQALLGNAPATLPPLRKHERLFFLRLWIQLQESIRGVSASAVSAIAQSVGCLAFASELLNSRDRSAQLIAILSLGHLRDASCWQQLSRFLLADDSARSFSALRALVQIDPARAARELSPYLLIRADWPLPRLVSLLQTEVQLFSTPLMQLIQESEGEALEKALRLANALHLQPPLKFVRQLLQQQQAPNLLAASLRIANLPQLLPDVRALAKHEDWRVRVQVAKVLSNIGLPEDVDVLLTMLSDRQWWVRYRAGQALLELPFLERQRLNELAQTLDDRFARDILHQLLDQVG